jgi:hypothetical protein
MPLQSGCQVQATNSAGEGVTIRREGRFVTRRARTDAAFHRKN